MVQSSGKARMFSATVHLGWLSQKSNCGQHEGFHDSDKSIGGR
jgi:hypothetical protein